MYTVNRRRGNHNQKQKQNKMIQRQLLHKNILQPWLQQIFNMSHDKNDINDKN